MVICCVATQVVFFPDVVPWYGSSMNDLNRYSGIFSSMLAAGPLWVSACRACHEELYCFNCVMALCMV